MAKKAPARRAIYDQNYYKAQAMVRNPWFKEKEAWLKKRFADVGCPLPVQPFKTYREYLAWNERFWKRYGEMEHGPEYKAEVQRITGGKERFSLEEYGALEEFKERYLPPVYGETFREILEHFHIDPLDQGFRDFLDFYFFFGQKEYHTTPLSIVWRREKPESDMELFIKIYPHTTRDDLLRSWHWIAHEQQYFKNRIGKNKAWTTFERDLEVYNLYKKLRTESGKKRQARWRATDQWIYSELHSEYPNLTTENIRTIISRTRERLGEI